MEHPAGESKDGPLNLAFDRRLKLDFHDSKITSDAGLLAYRELDGVLGLTEHAGTVLSDRRRGRNRRHLLTGLLRQSVFGRLAGYEDVNDANRLSRDPAMRAVVDRTGLDRIGASTSQMARFETEWLVSEGNLVALSDLSVQVRQFDQDPIRESHQGQRTKRNRLVSSAWIECARSVEHPVDKEANPLPHRQV